MNRLSLPRCGRLLLAALACAALPLPLLADPQVVIGRHDPCNLFDAGEPVKFAVSLKGWPGGKADLTARLTDAEGKVVQEKSETVDSTSPWTLDFGVQSRSYYNLKVTASSQNGGTAKAEGWASLGVMEFVNRTAQQARDEGDIFGLKWWAGIKAQKEVLGAMTKLGLQWTRLIQNEKGQMTTGQMVTEFPLNAVVKVERFPKELYDDARYGPMDEWDKKYGKGSWVIKTLPKKEPYQKWLREQLSMIPKDQKVFEIWNEPWDKMTAQDLATLSQWISEVILADRPDAIIGPNLFGSTSPFEYDAQVIDAGGLKGMKMVALHPYGVSENREWLRKYRQWLNEKTGQEMEIYVTEYGSHSTPEGPAKRSELEQARRVVRQSLSLYAEGVKALIPHWAGQTEKDRTYVEDWFGFLRKNEEPKPVLLAHANCARLIDGSRYEGDLWLGPQVAAMLFEKKGQQVLALWTLGEQVPGQENTASKEVTLDPGAPEVVLCDMFGRERKLAAEGGKVTLKLDEAPVYLVGVGADLAKAASKELRADLWPKPAKPIRRVRPAGRLASPPIDGKFDAGKAACQISLLNPKVAGNDCSGMGYVGWDDQYLYVGVDIRDNELLNRETPGKLFRGDSLELFVSAVPRDEGSGFGPRDYQFFLAPTSGEGKPVLAVVADRQAGEVAEVKNAKFFGGPTAKADKGWAVAAAIPWSALGGFAPAPGAKLALEMRVNDADTSHERFKVDPEDAAPNFQVNDPSTWSLLELKN